MSSKVAVAPDSTTCVDLLDMESGAFMYLDGVTTVTFFDGPVPLEQLKDRLVKVVQASPWLGGKLMKKKEDKKVIQMSFDSSPSREFIVEKLLDQIELDISASMPCEALMEKIQKDTNGHVKDTGFGLLKKNLHYTRLTIITNPSKPDSWALVWSISHVIADGYTYYKTLGMLSSTEEVKTLHPERKHDFVPKLKEAVSPEVYKTYLGAPGLMMNYAGNMMFGGKPRIRGYYVDLEKVEAEKKKSTGYNGRRATTCDPFPTAGTDFFSTNDILTAWFGRLTGARLMEMAVNFRGRIEDIDKDLAGNYEGCILFSNEDFEGGPGSIRKALQRTDGKFQSTLNPPKKLPGFCEMRSCKYRIITNWASFFSELVFDGCTQTLHMPYMNASSLPTDLLVIFRPTKDTLGVFIVTRKLSDEKLTAGDSLLGKLI